MTHENPSQNQVGPFDSLPSMRAAHADLIKLRRAKGVETELFTQAAIYLVRGVGTGMLLDEVDERQAAQSLLDYWDNVLAKSNLDRPDPTLAEFDIALAPELADDACPYLGLSPFSEQTSDLFFGRQRFVDSFLDHVRAKPLISLVGPSGSGKSSVVLGGVIPQLKQDTVFKDGTFISIVPGRNPLRSLVTPFVTLSPPNSELEIQEALEYWSETAVALHEALEKQATADNQPVILIIDQFEELFTLCLDILERNAVLEQLVYLINKQDKRFKIILTMRTDFESHVIAHEKFSNLFLAHTVRMMPLNAAELREAIEKPADRVGLKFEKGVVEALVQDIVGEPAALPLLQFTLLKLWENRARNRVTWEAYKKLGGGRLALARSADELYKELIPEEQMAAKRILLRMVRPTEGLEVTSSRVKKETLYQTGEANDRIDRVLERLVAGNLVRKTGDKAGSEQIEVAHEALVRNWPRLVEWLEEERVKIRRWIRLTHAAEEWQASGEDPDRLWRGEQLEEVASYEELTELETLFLKRSKLVEEESKMRERYQLELLVSEGKKRESEQHARKLAEMHARKLRRQIWIITGTFALVTLILFISIPFLQKISPQSQGIQYISEIVERFNSAETAIANIQLGSSIKFNQTQMLLLLSTAILPSDRIPSTSEKDLSTLMAIQAIQLNQITDRQIEPLVIKNQMKRLSDELNQPYWDELALLEFASAQEDQSVQNSLKLLIETACKELERNLTWDEWQQYLSAFPYQQTCPNLPIHPSVPASEQPMGES